MSARGQFVVSEVPEEVRVSMIGKSYPRGKCEVSWDDLRLVSVMYVTAEGCREEGLLVVNKAIAEDVKNIFKELYENDYPIERISLIDVFDADDERSMRANNTSSFCYRKVAGENRLSKHGLGMAVDLNPLYNPCFRVTKSGKGYTRLQPATAEPYVDRSQDFPYKLTSDDLAVKTFKKYGFRWGGDWKSKKDLHHFEK